MRNAWRMILVLGLVSVASGMILAGFYGWMGPRIEAQQLREQFEVGFKQIFPEAADFKAVTPVEPLPERVEEPVYQALDSSGNVLGLVYNAIGDGYGGPVKVAVGVDPDQGQIVGLAVLSHTETAGLGSRIEEPSFRDQFAGKPVTDPFEVGRDVDGITAATVSSQAVSRAVGETARGVLEALGYSVPDGATHATPDAETHATTSATPDTTSHATPAEKAGGAAGPSVEAVQALFGAGVDLGLPLWPVWDEAGAFQGVVVESSADGFKGPIRVLVAIDPVAGRVQGIQVVEQNETKGLGDKVTLPEFTDQFVGMPLDAAFQVGVDVDTVTRATVSSKAVTEAVAQAVEHVKAIVGQGR